MKTNKYLIVALLLLLPALLFADPVSATGYGESRADAQANARENLVAMFLTSVESSSYISSFANSSGYSGQNLASQSSQSFAMDLVGVTVSEPVRTEDGGWQVVASLREDSLSFYVDRANQLAEEINDLYASNNSLANYETVSYEEFDQLSDLVTSYETYRNVVRMLSPSSLSGVGSIQVTQSQITAQLNAKRNAEENDLEKELGTYQYREELIGQLGAEDQQRMEELQARIDELHQDTERRQAELREEHERRLDEIKAQFDTVSSFNYGDYYDDTVSEGDSYLTETLNQLEIRKEGYGVLMEALSNALEDIYESMESEASEYRDAQMNQPYYGLELDATGKPASEAVARRSELVEAYIDEEIRPDYIEQAERVTEDYAEQLAQVQLNILDIIEALNEKELTYNSFQDELTVAITGYDETSMEFAGYANIAIGSQTVRFDISFSYADWTGENVNTSPETMEEYYEYQQYAANAAQWSQSLMENSALFMLEVDFYVEAYTDSQRYAVFVDSYDVTRMDTGDRVVHNKDVGMRYLSSGRTAYFNFSSVPLTAGARECILYFDYYGILAEEQEKEDIPELWNIYAYEPDTSANFNNADEDDRRAQAGSMIFDNEFFLTFNYYFRSGRLDGSLRSSMLTTLGGGVQDLLHIGPNAKTYGFLVGVGADAGFISDGDDRKFSDVELNARIGLGGYLRLKDSFYNIKLMASAVGSYFVSAQVFAVGVEGKLDFNLDFGLFNGGIGVSARYDFYYNDPIIDSPWTFGINISAAF